jgi:hypothetical protein
MKKFVLIGFGALFITLGALMLVVVIRDGGHNQAAGQAVIGPLALIGGGALSISAAQRKPKKW